MAVPSDITAPCLQCHKCSGFKMHKWRSCCTECDCGVEGHDIMDERFNSCLEKLGLFDHPLYTDYQTSVLFAKQAGYQWLPIGIKHNEIDSFLSTLPKEVVASFTRSDDLTRAKAFRCQIPIPDRSINDLRSIKSDSEKSEAQQFISIRNNKAFGIGIVDRQNQPDGQDCVDCHDRIRQGEFCIRAKQHSNLRKAWHYQCFKCSFCRETLVDNIYCWHSEKLFCERHYAQLIRPRCAECDELIFTEEYTKAMDQDHHIEHFACKSCDKSLTGYRYVLKDDKPFCLQCYEDVFANSCEQCSKKIGCDSKDLSFKDRHWHEKCFNCSICQISLMDRPFASRDDQLFCSDCYDNRFATRCDACHNVFKAGMRKFEYRGKQWHEECFTCLECLQPIGSRSFIPREQHVVCVPCYEKKYAQRCTKCSQVIRRGGVTYKNNPWHKECFTCFVCNKELAGIKFITKDENPYCADCYGDLFSKKCLKCTKPISGIGGCKFISFEDRHWHSECFNCNKCDVNLVGKGFLTTDGEIVCPDCGQ